VCVVVLGFRQFYAASVEAAYRLWGEAGQVAGRGCGEAFLLDGGDFEYNNPYRTSEATEWHQIIRLAW